MAPRCTFPIAPTSFRHRGLCDLRSAQFRELRLQQKTSFNKPIDIQRILLAVALNSGFG